MAKELIFKLKVVDESGNVVEKALNNIKDLKKAQQELSAQLEKTPIGSAKWKELKANLQEVEKAQQKATIAQKGFIGTLKDIPGPLGALGQGLGGLNTAFKALIANPVGAVIAALGIVFTALTKALNSTEEGMFKLNKIFGAFTGIIDPIVKGLGEFASLLADKIIAGIEGVIKLGQRLGIVGENFGKAATEGMNLANALNEIDDAEGDLAVKRAQQNKLLAEAREILTDTNAKFEDRKKALSEIQKSEESLAAEEVALARKRLKAAQDTIRLKGASKEALDNEEQALIKLAQAEEDLAAKKRLFNREEKKLIAEQVAGQKEREKAEEDRLKKEEEVLDKIRNLRNENYLNSLSDERFREQEAARLDQERALRELNSLEINETQKGELRNQINEQFRIRIQAINKKYDDKEKDTEKKKLENLKNLRDKIQEAQADTAEERRTLEIRRTEEYFDNLIQQAKDAGIETEELEKAKTTAILKIQADFFMKEYNQIQARNAAMKSMLQDEIQDEINAIQAKMDIRNAFIEMLVNIGGIVSDLAGENKKAQIAGLLIEKAAAMATIISNTAGANAKAVLASPLTAGQPWVGINTASAVIAGIKVVTETARAISQINAAEEPGSISAPAPAGSKFQGGGLLMGASHSQGGVKTMFGELEGGEFIVNRLATQQFMPMLESMNQVGQSQSERMMSGSASAPIIKTYVVASDMSSELEKKRKLDELARL